VTGELSTTLDVKSMVKKVWNQDVIVLRFCLMWRTPYGDRTLGGAEAIVFAESLLNLLAEVILCDFDDYELGIKCFDTLTFGQKISVLMTIVNGLFRKDVKAYCLYTTLVAHRLP
jgi:hypothetical protein